MAKGPASVEAPVPTTAAAPYPSQTIVAEVQTEPAGAEGLAQWKLHFPP